VSEENNLTKYRLTLLYCIFMVSLLVIISICATGVLVFTPRKPSISHKQLEITSLKLSGNNVAFQGKVRRFH
jgi:hypothetical protein